MDKTKHQVLKYLFTKLDNIKLEIYNMYKYRYRIRILYDFEKDSRISSHDNKFIIRDEINKKKGNVIKEVKDYLYEIKWLPLQKILKESRKVIFYDEYIYLIKENNIFKCNFLNEFKKNKIIENKVEEDKFSINKVEENQLIKNKLEDQYNINKVEENQLIKNKLEDQYNINKVEEDQFNINKKEEDFINIKRIKLSDKNNSTNISHKPNINYYKEKNNLKDRFNDFLEELKQYFLVKRRFFPSFINLHLKNHFNEYLFLSKNTYKNLDLQFKNRDKLIKTYKDKISLFRYCKSRSSIYYKFIKNIQTTGLHQSFKKINDKFIYTTVKELSKNKSNLESEESSLEMGYNSESNTPLPSNLNYQSDFNKEGVNYEEIVEGYYENITEYPFYVDPDE